MTPFPPRSFFRIAGPAAFIILALFSSARQAMAEDTAAKADPRYPFRTDFANANLPWYQPKNLEFPPHHSDRRISGELVHADFVHRSGQFRMTKTGELVDFSMPPYGAVNYLNAEADLRDVPLGTYFLFFLNQDEHGGFTRLATMQDQFTMDAGHSFSYRLDEIQAAAGKLVTTKQSITKKQPDLGKRELLVTPRTRFWKGGKEVKLADLAVGDELLFNLTAKTATNPGWCTEVWAGTDMHTQATEGQGKKFVEFNKARGLPGWINKTEGNLITMTLFSGDAGAFKKTWMNDFVVGKDAGVCVANDELRTWNPPVDKERATVMEIQTAPTDCYGCSGVRLVLKVNYMLEGFRKGRVLRVYGSGWKPTDQYYGESLMGYGYSRLNTSELVELTPKEYPKQFPFRTDYGNEHLPWYKLEGSSGQAPPAFSQHLMLGDLLKVDVEKRTGQFRAERTGELVDFALTPNGTVRYLNADAGLADIPVGTRCRFDLYQDDKGAFALANLISDEFSFMAANVLTYWVETLKLDEGKLWVTRQLPEVKNYNGDMEQPKPIARTELRVTPETKVWKGDAQVALADLKAGDVLLANVTAEQKDNPSRCTEIWIGADTHKLVTEKRAKKPATAKK